MGILMDCLAVIVVVLLMIWVFNPVDLLIRIILGVV